MTKTNTTSGSDWRQEFEERFSPNSTFSVDSLKSFITKIEQEAYERGRREVVDAINPMDLIEDCNPDCTPEEHAYHSGTWKAHWKLVKILDHLKNHE